MCFCTWKGDKYIMVTGIVDLYKNEMVRILKRAYPYMPSQDIEMAVNYSINKRYKDEPCIVDNNYKKITIDDMTLRQVSDWILAKQPICTSYGVLIKRHGKVEHPLIELIRHFMEDRDVYKKMKFEYLEKHDYENVAKYDLMQLLTKRDGNSIYGCMGNAASLLYNLYIAASITAQGQSTISSAILFFESFLSNSVSFGSLEEVLHFIDNIVSEESKRKFKDSDILDFNIDTDMCFAKVMKSCIDWRKGKIKWIPSYDDAKLIYYTIKNLSAENKNRLFYKNNLYAFLDNRTPMNAIRIILQSLRRPYLTPKDVPDEIKVELEVLQDILREYVMYNYMYIDRIDRNINMIKNVCVVSDTDSAIVSFDAFYHFVLEKIMGTDIDTSAIETNVDDYIKSDDYIRKTTPKQELRYDFYNQKVVELESNIQPAVLIPQDNVRFSIINIIAYIAGNLCNEYILEYTKSNNSYRDGEKCLLYLKNEFLFSRMLLTDVKKNYASNQELQEGVILEQGIDTSMDIKGLPIKKSVTNDAAREALYDILYNDILKADNIDQLKIIEKIAIIEDKIKTSLMSGDKAFYKPLIVKGMSAYEDPMRIQGVKASIIWNRLRDNGLPAINVDARNSIYVIKVLITPSNISKIRESYPEIYEKAVDLFQDDSIFKGEANKREITTLAIPRDTDTPKWVMEFIDYATIINDNLNTFPVESIGIPKLGKDNINYSTIMKI